MAKYEGINIGALKNRAGDKRVFVPVHLNVGRAIFVPIDMDEISKMESGTSRQYSFTIDDRVDAVYIDGIVVIETVKSKK